MGRGNLSGHQVLLGGKNRSEPTTSIYTASVYVDIGLCGVAIVLLCFGILSIYLCKRKLNQNILFVNISLAEMVLVVFHMTHMALEKAWKENGFSADINCFKVINSIKYFAALQVLHTMYILTLDRLIMAAYPLRYKTWMTRRRIIRLNVIAFIIATGVAVFNFLNRTLREDRVGYYILVGGGIYPGFALFTYTYIFVKARNSRRRFLRRRTPSDRQHLRFRKDFFVPFVIITTYVLFYFTARATSASIEADWGEDSFKARCFSITYGVLIAMPKVGMIIDVVAFVYFTPQYRYNVVRLCSSSMNVRSATVLTNQRAALTLTKSLSN